MAEPQYTPAVKDLAERIRKLTIGEMLALREALRKDFDLPLPDDEPEDEPGGGVREPRTPLPQGGSGAIALDPKED